MYFSSQICYVCSGGIAKVNTFPLGKIKVFEKSPPPLEGIERFSDSIRTKVPNFTEFLKTSVLLCVAEATDQPTIFSLYRDLIWNSIVGKNEQGPIKQSNLESLNLIVNDAVPPNDWLEGHIVKNWHPDKNMYINKRSLFRLY